MKFIIPYFLSISDEKGQIDYPSLSQNFEMKPQLKIVLIYQVLTKQYMKKYLIILPNMTTASLTQYYIIWYLIFPQDLVVDGTL